jgi:hypothetical protein
MQNGLNNGCIHTLPPTEAKTGGRDAPLYGRRDARRYYLSAAAARARRTLEVGI